jgi:hypothetical protein
MDLKHNLLSLLKSNVVVRARLIKSRSKRRFYFHKEIEAVWFRTADKYECERSYKGPECAGIAHPKDVGPKDSSEGGGHTKICIAAPVLAGCDKRHA